MSLRMQLSRSSIAIALLGTALVGLAAMQASAAVNEPRSKKGPPPAPTYNLKPVAMINEQIRSGWEANSLTPSVPASDGEWCRRLFLDLLGRVPSVQELVAFTNDKDPDKKAKLVSKLLGDEFVEDYASNWTTLWTNILIGRTGGTERRSPINRPGMQQSLRRAFQGNMPYDKFVYNCISAKGVTKSGDKNFNGFVNFLVGALEENGVEATARSSQIFLGVQVRCTQCHNHPFNEWKQNQFWEMNAFFRQTKAIREMGMNREVESAQLFNQDFAGEDNRPDQAALFYELRNGLTKVAYPVFVDGSKLKTDSGYLDEVDRRTELGKMMIKSDLMPKALVNRYWAHFMGYGFTKPIDDMGPHNPPTHPALLDSLANEFKTHSYDLKELIRWIVLSESYSLSSKYSVDNKKDDPSLGEKPSFSHFYLRQMRAEELYESLIVATEAQKTRGSYEEQEASKRDWLRQFNIAFGTDDNDETTTFNGTIPQVLMMMNGDLVNKATSSEKGSFLDNVATNAKFKPADRIDYLYLAALGRRPTTSEVGVANQAVGARKNDVVAALQDIWWVLLNSNEFILNH